jgi:putative tricarboxylic transport membrane protein
MLDALGLALTELFRWDIWLLLSLGTGIGLILGAMPGIGGLVPIALLIPLTYGMDPNLAFSLLIGIHGSVAFGGSISAILINTPGTSMNAATCLDGFQMTQKGEARRALAISATACFLGALFGLIVLFILLPVLRAIVLTFGPPEIFMLCVMGLTLIAALSRASLVKGLISAGLGLLLACVGFDPVSGETRYAIGLIYLWDGVKLVPVIIGLFALAELIDLTIKGGSIASKEDFEAGGSVLEGIKDVFRHSFLFIRASALGTLIGIIPGAGGSVANWVAYGQAVATSKRPERFGTGIPEGIIAPEAANDSKDGGALIPTLAFGVPGSEVWAIMLGAFMIHGLDPGPTMLTEHLDFVIFILILLVISNFIASLFGLIATNWLAKITIVPIKLLTPVIMVIALTGAFGLNNQIGDVIMAVLFGFLGYWMKKNQYSRAAMILALVLGEILERNFWLAQQTFGYSFLFRPITLILLAITVYALFIPVLHRRKIKNENQ